MALIVLANSLANSSPSPSDCPRVGAFASPFPVSFELEFVPATCGSPSPGFFLLVSAAGSSSASCAATSLLTFSPSSRRDSVCGCFGGQAPWAGEPLKSCGSPPGSGESDSLVESTRSTLVPLGVRGRAESPLSFLLAPGNSAAPSSVLLACDRARSDAPRASLQDIALAPLVSQNAACRACFCSRPFFPGLSSTLSSSIFRMCAPMCSRARSASLCALTSHSLASFP